MKKKHLAVWLSTALLLTSCSGLRIYSNSDVMAIEPNMTKEQVIEKLGNPHFRSFEKQYEELEYNLGYISSTDYMTLLKVRLENNHVVSVESFPMRPRPEVKHSH